jgi:hypothetical protein
VDQTDIGYERGCCPKCTPRARADHLDCAGSAGVPDPPQVAAGPHVQGRSGTDACHRYAGWHPASGAARRRHIRIVLRPQHASERVLRMASDIPPSTGSSWAGSGGGRAKIDRSLALERIANSAAPPEAPTARLTAGYVRSVGRPRGDARGQRRLAPPARYAADAARFPNVGRHGWSGAQRRFVAPGTPAADGALEAQQMLVRTTAEPAEQQPRPSKRRTRSRPIEPAASNVARRHCARSPSPYRGRSVPLGSASGAD